MTGQAHLSDLELAALISSRICHDVISPVGAISNGLEVLEEEEEEQVREYAFDLIKRSAEQASAKLQFARLAFGAAGSAGSEIDLNMAAQVAKGIFDEQKHQFSWNSDLQLLVKDKTKLLLNMVTIAITTLPRGGQVAVNIAGPAETVKLGVQCSGQGARIPEGLPALLSGQAGTSFDTLSIQPYYTSRIAASCGMAVQVQESGADIILSAQ